MRKVAHQMSNALSRAGIGRRELYGIAFLIAFVNGVEMRVAATLGDLVSPAIVGGRGISAVVWAAGILALRMFAKASPSRATASDLAVTAVVMVICLLPVSKYAWLAMTMMAIYLYWHSPDDDEMRAAAVIAGGICVAMLWAKIIPFVAGPTLERFDAAIAGWLSGAKFQGNVLYFPDGRDSVMLGWGCSSYSNLSLALLLWIAVTRSLRPRPIPGELIWLAAVVLSVIVINSLRLILLIQGRQTMAYWHGPIGQTVFGVLLLVVALAITLFGARRELLA